MVTTGCAARTVPSSGIEIWKSERNSSRKASKASSARSISSISRIAVPAFLSALSSGISTRNSGA